MKVLMDNVVKGTRLPRKLVDVSVIERKANSIKVMLPDGNIITRRKGRDYEVAE